MDLIGSNKKNNSYVLKFYVSNKRDMIYFENNIKNLDFVTLFKVL